MRKQFTQPPNKRLLHRRGIRTARNVSNPDYPEHIPEIVIVSSSSDEDDGPPQAKCKATGRSISKAAVPLFVSKEVEDVSVHNFVMWMMKTCENDERH